MVSDTNKPLESTKTPIEERLKALYALQVINRKIDRLHELMGALPLEVQDLEDEVVGLETRIENYKHDIENLEKDIREQINKKKDADELINKYLNQQKEVRNNREYDALNKEIEYQKLEIELADKKMGEHNQAIEDIKNKIDQAEQKVKEKKEDLDHKRKELEEIIEENKKDEQLLVDKRNSYEEAVDDRYLNAFKRIRKSMRNGLAVVTFHRNACGGCFNRIPPQRQLDIASRRKVIVCEHCGRILVDSELAKEVDESIDA